MLRGEKGEREMVVIGVDPGEKGAIAILGEASAQVYDMRECQEVLRLLREHNGDFALAVIEDCHAFPRINATTNFKAGLSLGFWEGVMRAFLIPAQFVGAGKWQRAICGSLPKERPARKQAIADWAGRRWPEVVLRGPRGAVLDGRSDALCLAEYGRRMLVGNAAARGSE